MKESYEPLKREFNLPSFEELDSFFDISSIEDATFVLRAVRKKIAEKIDYFCSILDDIIHPESSFASFREATVFTDPEKEEVLELYKKLMFFSRLSIELNIEDSNAENADFINKFMLKYPEIKKHLKIIIIKLKESWEGDIDKKELKEIVGYLG